MSAPQTPPAPGYVRALRRELVSAVAADRDRREARRRLSVRVGAVAAALALVLAGINLLDATTTPALAIDADGNAVTVSLVDATADPAAMTRQLAEAGVGAVVVAQPVPDALVGRWVGGEGRALAWTETSVTLPRDARGVVLRVGVPGGNATLQGSAFAPGGLLACTGLQGAPADQAAAELDRRALAHTWRDAGSGAALSGPVPGHVVVEASLDRTGTVVLLSGTTAPSTIDQEQSCG